MSATRMNQRRKREKNAKPATLNLVSLMDIFTILVFFLMVNSSDVEVLEIEANIKLPDSNAEQRPEERLVISVNADDLMLQGKKIASIESLMSEDNETIVSLSEALVSHQKAELAASQDSEAQSAITIMGDRELPYQLLKRIMLTCQRADYVKIALAVNRAASDQASLSDGGVLDELHG